MDVFIAFIFVCIVAGVINNYQDNKLERKKEQERKDNLARIREENDFYEQRDGAK